MGLRHGKPGISRAEISSPRRGWWGHLLMTIHVGRSHTVFPAYGPAGSRLSHWAGSRPGRSAYLGALGDCLAINPLLGFTHAGGRSGPSDGPE